MLGLTQIILIPVPVPEAGQNGGWQKSAKPVYPRKPSKPLPWPPAQPIPTHDAREALAYARRLIAETRDLCHFICQPSSRCRTDSR
jgi:hypothetical protein